MLKVKVIWRFKTIWPSLDHRPRVSHGRSPRGGRGRLIFGNRFVITEISSLCEPVDVFKAFAKNPGVHFVVRVAGSGS